jgi:hypothetical protein
MSCRAKRTTRHIQSHTTLQSMKHIEVACVKAAACATPAAARHVLHILYYYSSQCATSLTLHYHTLFLLRNTNSRPLSLDMRTADDTTAVLRMWRVNTAVKGRPLSELHRTSNPSYGVFSSADAYVVLHSSKNGTRHAVYLWVGSDAAVATKAALTIQVSYTLISMLW